VFTVVDWPTDFPIFTAEAALKTEEAKPGFSLLLLNLIASEALPLTTRLSGALCFKNFIKFNWVVCSSLTGNLAATTSDTAFRTRRGTINCHRMKL
jgi:hypothetical protein